MWGLWYQVPCSDTNDSFGSVPAAYGCVGGGGGEQRHSAGGYGEGFWERTKSDLVLYVLEEMVMHTDIHLSVRQVRM